MDSQGEIFRLCRLCLVKDQVDIPIFDDPGDERQILLKISSCLPVTVSQDDDLPKKICDVCSEKLDSFYEFWNSTASAEKTLRDRLAQEVRQSEPMVPKPIKTLIKEESEVLDEAHAEPVAEEESTKDETEAPPRKRPRRVSAIKAQVSIAAQESDDEEFDTAELVTKVEDGSDEMDIEEKVPNLLELPGTSTDIDQDQAGPSGLGKDGAEAPFYKTDQYSLKNLDTLKQRRIRRRKLSSTSWQKFTNHEKLYVHNLIHEEESDVDTDKNEERIIILACDTGTDFLVGANSETSSNCMSCNCDLRIVDGSSSFCQSCRQGSSHNMNSPTQLAYQCSECFEEFNDLQELGYHFATSHKIKTEGTEELKTEVKIEREVKNEVYQWPFSAKRDFLLSNKKPVIKISGKRNQQNMDAASCSTNQTTIQSVKKESKLKTEGKVIDPTKGAYCCSKCGKCFQKKYKLKFHFKIHTGHKPYSCEKCEKCFTYKHHLKSHLKIHSKEKNMHPVKEHICQFCGKHFSWKRNLDVHLQMHTGVKKEHSGEQYVCQLCGKHFARKFNLQVHLKLHTGEKKERPGEEHICLVCGKTFSRKDNLAVHLTIHSGEKPYICEECGQSFRQKSTLDAHLRTHNRDISKRKPYLCEDCGKSFALKCSLEAHITEHTGEKPYICEICGKSFSLKGHLSTHLRSHTCESSFVCEECGKCFSQKGALKSHLSVLHTGDSPFKCKECGKCFQNRKRLENHLKVHTEKP